MWVIPRLTDSQPTNTTKNPRKHYGLRMAKRIPEDRERGLRISELIEDGGWQVSHLAREIDADRSRIYDWMNGAAMNSASLTALAGALGTTREYLLTGEGPISREGEAGAAAAALQTQISEIRSDQVAMQSDLAKLVLEIQGLREDLRRIQAPGAQRQGGQG